MRTIFIIAVISLLLLSGVQSLAALENKNIGDYVTNFETYTRVYKIEKPSNEAILDNNIRSSFTSDGDGSILWSYVNPYSVHWDSCICANGAYVFASNMGIDTVSFQLFNTLGTTGIPEWEFNPLGQHIYPQVDASKEADTLVGLAASDDSIPPKDSIKRLYRWDLFDDKPCWYFDIPDDLHVFNSGGLEDNIAVSDNGKKIILGTSDVENQIMKIYVFDSDSEKPVLIFPFVCKYPYYDLLDVSYDGSIVFVTTPLEVIIVDTTLPGIRWRGDPNGVYDHDDIVTGAISGDGSVLIGKYWNNGHCFKAFKWNDIENDYDEIWDQKLVPTGWFLAMNLHTLEVSNDGSTFMVGFSSMDQLETRLFLYDVDSGNFLWEHHTIAGGEYRSDIKDICLSEDGSKGIVAYTDDEFGMNPEVKVFHRENSIPIFTLDAPATAYSADISPDGNLAVAGGDLYPSDFISSGTFICAIDLGINNDRPEKPSISGPSTGKALEDYEYVFSAFDPDGDDVFFFINWGDGDIEECIGPVDSGEEITLKHNWSRGNYQIKVKAKDSKGFYSDWEIQEISMPKRKLLTMFFSHIFEKYPLLLQFLTRIRLYI